MKSRRVVKRPLLCSFLNTKFKAELEKGPSNRFLLANVAHARKSYSNSRAWANPRAQFKPVHVSESVRNKKANTRQCFHHFRFVENKAKTGDCNGFVENGPRRFGVRSKRILIDGHEKKGIENITLILLAFTGFCGQNLKTFHLFQLGDHNIQRSQFGKTKRNKTNF